MYDHPVKLQITAPQMRKLGRGHAVIIKHDHLGKGAHHIHLHHEQHRRMLSALKNRRGMKLHFSPDQVRYHEGKGLWDKLKSAATNALENTASNLAEKGLNKAGDYLVDKVVGSGRRRKRGKGFLDSIKNIGNKVGDAFSLGGVNPFQTGYDLGHDVIGPAIMGKGRRRKMKGEGILEDVIGTVGSLLGGRVRRKYHKRGGALFPAGYSGGALNPSDKHMVDNGIRPFVSGTPPYYSPYDPKDSFAVKHLK